METPSPSRQDTQPSPHHQRHLHLRRRPRLRPLEDQAPFRQDRAGDRLAAPPSAAGGAGAGLAALPDGRVSLVKIKWLPNKSRKISEEEAGPTLRASAKQSCALNGLIPLRFQWVDPLLDF